MAGERQTFGGRRRKGQKFGGEWRGGILQKLCFTPKNQIGKENIFGEKMIEK